MYAKVFQSMFQGSLATRGPWQAVVTFQQLLVLADRFGIVDMTPEAISRQTTIPLEIIREGLTALAQPDPESRRPDHEGRRIILLDPARTWGWQIVNHAHYAQIRSGEERAAYQRQYMREWRQGKRRTPTGDAKPKAKGNGADAPGAEPGVFTMFYKDYPRKTGRAKALKAWLALNPSPELCEKIASALHAQKPQWSDPKYIPHPATWLNGRRWEDEPLPAAHTPTSAVNGARCYYCSQPAVKLTNDIPHCARADHLDFAVARRT